MGFTDAMVTIAVLLGIFIIIYSKVKNQELKDTLDELKDIIQPASIEPGVMP